MKINIHIFFTGTCGKFTYFSFFGNAGARRTSSENSHAN
jgi:hypothetical protein